MPNQILSDKALQALIEYLQYHDEDIADGINDFGELREVYEELCVEKREKDWIQRCDEICNQHRE